MLLPELLFSDLRVLGRLNRLFTLILDISKLPGNDYTDRAHLRYLAQEGE